jgi:hypothetical protein
LIEERKFTLQIKLTIESEQKLEKSQKESQQEKEAVLPLLPIEIYHYMKNNIAGKIKHPGKKSEQSPQ